MKQFIEKNTYFCNCIELLDMNRKHLLLFLMISIMDISHAYYAATDLFLQHNRPPGRTVQ